MAQAPMPQAQGPAPQGPSDQGQMGPSPGDALTEMIVQTDQSLTKIAQVLSKASPEAAKALAQLNEQYRKLISAVMNGAGGAEGPQPEASQMVSPETRGKPSMQAY